MHVRKESHASGSGRCWSSLLLALLVARRSRSSRPAAAAPAGRTPAPALIGKGGGFGEVYQAKASTLKKTLFNATLLPTNPTSRNIALAGLGRADKKVNHDLALKCWKNNGCSTGHGRQAHRRLHRAVRRERLPPDVEDGVHPPGADVSAGRQDHLQERPLRPEPGHRRLQGGDRAEGQPDRHLSGLRRRDAAGDEGSDRRRNPGRDVCLGLRHRARQELPDGRRRVHLQRSARRSRT